MLPVEVDVANQLELGFLEFKPWTETWNDELNSAVAVGADGEAKVVHRIWPKGKRKKLVDGSRPTTAERARPADEVALPASDAERSSQAALHSESFKSLRHVAAEPYLDANKDKIKQFANSSVLYRNDKEAYILRPSFLPSAYYGRRPVAKIRKGIAVGIAVVRGFSWKAWHKIHPTKMTATLARAWEGAATSASGVTGASICNACWAIEQPQKVSDLILIIHGYGDSTWNANIC